MMQKLPAVGRQLPARPVGSAAGHAPFFVMRYFTPPGVVRISSAAHGRSAHALASETALVPKVRRDIGNCNAEQLTTNAAARATHNAIVKV
mmetsp:Transcript_7964/g.24604  ORF Transcript_7964/g.24604 Transcript_7964/m.24604 type:complete len:91 (-) Transcript_7964:37-309(-)